MFRMNVRAGTLFVFLAVGLTIGFAVMSMGFGLWIQQFTVTETVNSGNVDLAFLAAFTDDDGAVDDPALDSQDTGTSTPMYDGWGITSSADPAATGPDPKAHYDKDVARCLASTVGQETGAITKEEAYPSYHCTAWYEMENSGTIPVKVRRITIVTASTSTDLDPDTDPTLLDLDNLDLDGDNSTGPDVEVDVGDLSICQQIDPGESVRMSLDQHVLQGAPQGTVLAYTVDVDVAQWNEVNDPLTELYLEVREILGPTAVVLHFGDPINQFKVCQSSVPEDDGLGDPSFDTVGAEALTFAWSEPPNSFDSPPSTQGIVPVVTFNGTDEGADSPDAAFWTRDDSGFNPASWGAWVNIDTAGSFVILGKFSNSNTDREWQFELSGGAPALRVYDQSSEGWAIRVADSAISTGSWHHVVVTYDSTGGSDAMGTSGSMQDNVTIYVDGAIVASTASDSPFYEAMEDKTGVVSLAYQNAGLENDASFFDGEIAGGPIGPFFALVELTAAEVLELYTRGLAALTP